MSTTAFLHLFLRRALSQKMPAGGFILLASGLILVSLLVSIVNTAPGPRFVTQLSKRQSSAVTTLDSMEISSFKPFTFFANTAYCNPNTTINWSCGANCDANSDFIPIASGGDGISIQFWYVGFSPSQGTVVVAHQGSNLSHVEVIATNVNIILKPLDSTLFPGISSSIQAHSGFANKHAKTARNILSAVQTAIAEYGATQVTIVGHSLGGAIALLDGIYLSLHISGVSFRTIGYGLPRVGNKAFADYLDANLSVTYINNKQDIVSILPGRFLGYHHPSGEVHIMDDDQWLSCPGQESSECIVPNIFVGSVNDHDGPYDGVKMDSRC